MNPLPFTAVKQAEAPMLDSLVAVAQRFKSGHSLSFAEGRFIRIEDGKGGIDTAFITFLYALMEASLPQIVAAKDWSLYRFFVHLTDHNEGLKKDLAPVVEQVWKELPATIHCSDMPVSLGMQLITKLPAIHISWLQRMDPEERDITLSHMSRAGVLAPLDLGRATPFERAQALNELLRKKELIHANAQASSSIFLRQVKRLQQLFLVDKLTLEKAIALLACLENHEEPLYRQAITYLSDRFETAFKTPLIGKVPPKGIYFLLCQYNTAKTNVMPQLLLWLQHSGRNGQDLFKSPYPKCTESLISPALLNRKQITDGWNEAVEQEMPLMAYKFPTIRNRACEIQATEWSLSFTLIIANYEWWKGRARRNWYNTLLYRSPPCLQWNEHRYSYRLRSVRNELRIEIHPCAGCMLKYAKPELLRNGYASIRYTVTKKYQG